MNKKRFALLAVAGLLVIGAGCSGNDSYTINADDLSTVTAGSGDASEARAIEQNTGVDLPDDATVTVNISNEGYTSSSYVTDLTPEEAQAFYETELTAQGYTESRPWFTNDVTGTSVTSGLYSNGETTFGVSISAQGAGSNVAIQVDQN